MSANAEANAVPQNEATTTAPKGRPSGGRGRGGRGARSRRQDDRRLARNIPVDRSMQEQAEKRLGIEERSTLATLTPASSDSPGGVQVSLLGFAENVDQMLKRMKSLALRPLAALLTDNNCLIYRKIAQYAAYARIAAAQDKAVGIAGCRTSLAGEVSIEDFRKIDAKCRIIPNYLARCYLNIGYFERDGQQVYPLLPHSDANRPTIACAMSASFFRSLEIRALLCRT